MRCSPGVICNIIGEMSENLKGRIRDLGFGQLLNMKLEKLEDRVLAMFLARSVKEDPLCIEVGRKVLPITAEAVRLVFGIPAGPRSLPDYSYGDKKEGRSALRKICDEKGLKKMFINRGGNYDRMGVSEVPRWFIEHFANAKESEVND